MTLAGIEPATFRFVAQHLNHCATAVEIINYYDCTFWFSLIVHHVNCMKKQGQLVSITIDYYGR